MNPDTYPPWPCIKGNKVGNRYNMNLDWYLLDKKKKHNNDIKLFNNNLEILLSYDLDSDLEFEEDKIIKEDKEEIDINDNNKIIKDNNLKLGKVIYVKDIIDNNNIYFI